MDKITNIQLYIFSFLIYLSYFLTLLVIISSNIDSKKYLYDLNYYIRIYISLYLIWRFNKFRHVQFNDLDRKIVFTSGLFIFSTTVIYSIIERYLEKIKKNLKYMYTFS